MDAGRVRTRRPSFLGAFSVFLVVGGLVALAVLLHVPSRVAAASERGLGAFFTPTSEAAYGDTLELAGASHGSVEVTTATPRTVRLPGQAARGNVLVGAPVSIRNLSEVSWSSSQGLEVHAVDDDGVTYDLRRQVTGRHLLRLPATVLPDHTVRGLLLFEVPRSAHIASVTVRVGEGLTHTGKWTSGS